MLRDFRLAVATGGLVRRAKGGALSRGCEEAVRGAGRRLGQRALVEHLRAGALARGCDPLVPAPIVGISFWVRFGAGRTTTTTTMTTTTTPTTTTTAEEAADNTKQQQQQQQQQSSSSSSVGGGSSRHDAYAHGDALGLNGRQQQFAGVCRDLLLHRRIREDGAVEEVPFRCRRRRRKNEHYAP